MECPACGTENRVGRRFCAQCGAALQVACPSCGTVNEPGDRFCGGCGTALLDDATAPKPTTQPLSERRLVSVLFADLVGFTTLSEHRDPEQVRELLSAYFDRCRELIERHGGTVEKFIGDAVMAVWGTPVAKEDDAERAVRAALGLTKAVTALGEEAGMPGLRARAAVLTGSAAVEIGAEGEGMVLGDTVNTASRLQSIAEPGTVLVDDVTRSVTEAAIAYEDAGVHELRGREQPVHAWTALRVVAAVGGMGRGAGLEAPFVGRSDELELIISASEESRRAGQARLVTVIGEAGLGKSRLLWEFEKYMDGIQEVVNWHQGRSLSYGEGVAYWALAEMVRGRAKIAEDEGPAGAREKLRASIGEYVPDERERRLIEPRLAHLLGLEQRVAPDRADLFSGWRLFFERMAGAFPVLLVFEDLQWADSGLLEFIDHLLEWSAEFPIFILAFARPEIVDARPQWEPTIILEPLGDEAMQELLDGLVPGLPEELSARIRARAEGVPLYAVETVRMLLDRGLLREEGASYAVAGDIEELDVPETLHALVAARLDGLDPAERALLQDAAVLGHSFSVEGVAALSGRPADEVGGFLDGLVAKQLIAVNDDDASPERGQYAFLQALMRTIAYGTLSRRDRKAKHLATARFLQDSWGTETGEIAEVLAAHFLDAAEAEPDAPDAPKIRDSALQTLADAGRRAISLALGREAQRAFDRATELAEDDKTRAELLEQAGRAAWLELDHEAARERLVAAIARYEQLDLPEAVAGAELVLSTIAADLADIDQAVAMGEASRERLPDNSPERAAAAAELARWHMLAFDLEAALRVVDEALEIAESLEDWGVLAEAFVTKGTVLYFAQRQHEGTALVHAGLRLARDQDLPLTEIRGLNNLSSFLLSQARAEEALAQIRQALELARSRGDRRWQAFIAGDESLALVALGRWDEALEVAARVAEVGGEDLATGLDASIGEARIYAARGQVDGVEAVRNRSLLYVDSPDGQLRGCARITGAIAAHEDGRHEEALELLRDLGKGNEAYWHRFGLFEAGRAALAADRDAELEQMVAAIVDAPPGETSPLSRALARGFTGVLASRRGEHPEALAGLDTAVAWLREIGDPFELAWALLERGRALVRAGQEAEAAGPLDEAREIYTRLRAEPWIRQVDEVLQAGPSRLSAAQ